MGTLRTLEQGRRVLGSHSINTGVFGCIARGVVSLYCYTSSLA